MIVTLQKKKNAAVSTTFNNFACYAIKANDIENFFFFQFLFRHLITLRNKQIMFTHWISSY